MITSGLQSQRGILCFERKVAVERAATYADSASAGEARHEVLAIRLVEGEDVPAAQAIEVRVAIEGVESRPTDHQIVLVAAVELVASTLSVQQVIARAVVHDADAIAAAENVVSRIAVEEVRLGAREQHVVPRATIQIIVHCCVLCVTAARRQIVVAILAIERIAARAAIHDIVAGACVDGVVSR